MKAAARIVAELEAGRTVLRVLKGEPPLLPRLTGPGEVHLVGGAAGPLGGDELSLEIEVGPGAALCIRTVAASIALPARSGAESMLTVHATVAESAFLAFLPEPIVAAARCHHHNASIVDIAEDAGLVWREEAVLGRFGEEPGRLRLSTTARRADRPWYRSDVTAARSPAELGDARVLASLLTTAPADPFATTAGDPFATTAGDPFAISAGDRGRDARPSEPFNGRPGEPSSGRPNGRPSEPPGERPPGGGDATTAATMGRGVQARTDAQLTGDQRAIPPGDRGRLAPGGGVGAATVTAAVAATATGQGRIAAPVDDRGSGQARTASPGATAGLGARAAVMALAGGGAVATALGADLAETRKVTDWLVPPALLLPPR
ncbi:urease accessory protein UreD [Dactylosporangium vinaceum]|uniref:Urease accessory protein UreD n=1 Tax=Dactylosporangium vinaceum TaxID=53362 RepID=A0ABV5M6G9_9ACTN|nr:urease accessory protein UreD [Dactylosporangium vinaceum]UAB97853.1 urease accessory protein UreD [Dactylosporangium vinaceum]